jgi:hypothetical protein
MEVTLTTNVNFDHTAQEIIAARLSGKPDLALTLILERVYMRGFAPYAPMLRWTSSLKAARSAHLVRMTGPAGVPLYIQGRLSRYLTWHPINVVGQRFGPFSRLLPAVDPLFAEDLLTWERQHTDVCISEVSSVA